MISNEIHFVHTAHSEHMSLGNPSHRDLHQIIVVVHGIFLGGSFPLLSVLINVVLGNIFNFFRHCSSSNGKTMSTGVKPK